MRTVRLALPLLLVGLACDGAATSPETNPAADPAADPAAMKPDGEQPAPEAGPETPGEPFAATAGTQPPDPSPAPEAPPQDGSCESMASEAAAHFAPFSAQAGDRPSCSSDEECTVSSRTASCAGPVCGQALHVSEVGAYEQAADAARPICEAYREASCPPRGMPRCMKPEATCIEGRCQRPSG